MNHAKFSFEFCTLFFFFFSFFLILIAFWCIQQASRAAGNLHANPDPESSYREWLSRSACSWLHAFSFRHWLKDRLLRQRAKWISSIRSSCKLQVVQVVLLPQVASLSCQFAQKKSASTLSLSRCSICKFEQFLHAQWMHRSLLGSLPSLSLSSCSAWRCCLRRLSFGFD